MLHKKIVCFSCCSFKK